MRSRIAIFMIAIGVGIAVAAGLQAASYWAYQFTDERLAHILNWPNAILQSLVPCNNVGSGEQRVCEGTPINVLAYIASLPIGVAVYSFIAYVSLRWWSARGN